MTGAHGKYLLQSAIEFNSSVNTFVIQQALATLARKLRDRLRKV